MVLVVVLVVLAGGGGGPRAGAGGSLGAGWCWGGGGSVGKMNFGTSFAPRSPTSFAHNACCCPAMQISHIQAKLHKYWVLLLSVPRVHCKVKVAQDTASFCSLPCRLN